MPNLDNQQPRIGVGLLIIKENQVLLGKRLNSHGAGEFCGPGGHLEYGETIKEAAQREINEECGIEVTNLEFLCISDLLTYFPKHYVNIGLSADWVSGEPKVLEPDRFESWHWYDMDNMPTNLFGCVQSYVDAYRTGQRDFTFTPGV